MKVWQRILLVTGIVVLAGGELGWAIHSANRRAEQALQAQTRSMQTRRASEPEMPAARHFTRQQVNDFLDAAKRAESIGDPVARCIAYPDPPGSHWPHDAVAAYCRYNLQPLMGFAEVRALIEHGDVAALDRRLTEARHAGETVPALRGQLDRIYLKAFEDGSFDIRPTLDAWKRLAPNSAYAWAASGTAYVAMAAEARGSAFISETPESNVRAMENLLSEAVSDLHQAIKLDPALAPAYTALIHAAGMDGSVGDADAITRDALARVPDDYSIYFRVMWHSQPKWGGSLAAMDATARQAQRYADANPLLKILAGERACYQVSAAGLAPAEELERLTGALDQFASRGNLLWASQLSNKMHDTSALAVFASQVLRFEPDSDEDRTRRAIALLDFDEADWALRELGTILARAPHDTYARQVRAYGFDVQGDHAAEEKDLRFLLADQPGDMTSRTRLGYLYANWPGHWDQAWSVADGIIRDDPQSPNGWLLRATIQQRQPRPGLADTTRQFEARFGKDPRFANTVLQLRAAAALQDGPRHAGRRATP